jgi:hypothetical protein
MPRPLRIENEGARYHVMSRGDRREKTINPQSSGSASHVSTLLNSVESSSDPLCRFEDREFGIGRSALGVFLPSGRFGRARKQSPARLRNGRASYFAPQPGRNRISFAFLVEHALGSRPASA